MRSLRAVFPQVVLLFLSSSVVFAQSAKEPRELIPPPFDRYLSKRVEELSSPSWQNEITRENWSARRDEMRAELQRMLGLNPWPARGDLKPTITGTVQGEGYVVEKLQFQSSPGLYVTANLYRPTVVKEPLPTILYVCGHSRVVENGVSFGNKTGYEHHGSWFARNGYVCLVLDTVQLGEILGEHWGTYSRGRWWWPARGYTPAGVEAWNGIRALDYLETRPEVDRTRLGVTGRSGGGAYSWWIAALDDRIKVAVPTAGVTTLHNHVIDGAIEGHCDCMFMVNTGRWEFDRLTALVAPRPLLIANTDKDEIFPLDGVMEIYNRTRGLYRRLGQEENIGLQIAEGPHKDTQPLNSGAFHWFNRFLKGRDRMDLIDEPARKRHEAAELRVFTSLPSDEKVTSVDQWFVPAASEPSVPKNAAEWAQNRDQLLHALRTECFRAWSKDPQQSVATKQSEASAEGLQLSAWEFTSEEPLRSTLWLLHRDSIKPEELELVVLNVLDDDGWREFQEIGAGAFPATFPGVKANGATFAEARQMLLNSKWAMAYVSPRGTGPTSFASFSERKRTQLLRRFQLIGETLESGQVLDITQAASALRSIAGYEKVPLWIQAEKQMAANALYASLFIPDVKRLDLHQLPASQRSGPIYLNILRHMDLPQAATLAAERSTLAIYSDDSAPWQYAQTVATTLGWGEKRVQIRKAINQDEPAASKR